MRSVIGVLSASLLWMIAGSAGALPLAVTESGDFSGSLPGTAVGTLGIGVNTISGDTADNAPLPDGDVFSVNLPGGLSISSLSLAVSSFVNGFAGSSFITLSAPGSGFEGFNGDGTVTVDPFTISGTTVEFVVKGDGGVVSGRDTFDYTLSITVVPEPATATLLAFGFAWARCRSRIRRWRSAARRRATPAARRHSVAFARSKTSGA